MAWMTRREYADDRGCSTQAVDYRVRVGTIRPRKDGKIDSARADAAWPRDPSVGGRPKKGASPARPSAPADSDSDGPGPAKLTPHERKAQADAEAKELDLAKKRGELVPVADIARTQRDFARRIHDALLDLPDAVQRVVERGVACASCGAATNAKLVALEVERHVRALLDRLADDPMGQARQ